MTTYLVIQKDGNIKQMSSKLLSEDVLYKRAGFTTNAHFKCYAKWSVENIKNKNYTIHVYGKTDGRANQENEYDFPPPIDNTLFFGNCLIINKEDDIPVDITKSEWKDIYENLFGGFEEINSEEDESESEDDGLPRTKSGYVKDDFIVDDDEVDDDYDEVDDSDEDDYVDESEEEPIVKKKKSVRIAKIMKPIPKKKIKKTGKKVDKDIPENVFISIDANLDCTNELCEEEYLDE